jgi:hypothetical protein
VRVSERGRLVGSAGPEQREHSTCVPIPRPAGSALARPLHQSAAQHDQLQPVALIECTGGDEGAQLSQRMAGHVVAVGAAERFPPGEARAVDRRLGEVRALVDAREGILAHGLGHRFEQVRAHARDLLAHAVGLAPLAREKNRRAGHHCKPTPARERGNRGGGDCPPIGGR